MGFQSCDYFILGVFNTPKPQSNAVFKKKLFVVVAGDVIRWEQQLRFRHMTTRQYLCITSDRRVTLTPDSKDPRTVFRLHPVIKVCFPSQIQLHIFVFLRYYTLMCLPFAALLLLTMLTNCTVTTDFIYNTFLFIIRQ